MSATGYMHASLTIRRTNTVSRREIIDVSRGGMRVRLVDNGISPLSLPRSYAVHDELVACSGSAVQQIKGETVYKVTDVVMSLLRKFAWKPAALLPTGSVTVARSTALLRAKAVFFLLLPSSCSKFNLIQSAHFLLFLAGDYAFSRIWITYEYIDKTIRSVPLFITWLTFLFRALA